MAHEVEVDDEQRLQLFYRSSLRAGMVDVDVGAHVGRHAREMTGLVRPNGSVWLCEPILEFPGFGGAVATSPGGDLILIRVNIAEADRLPH